MDDSIIIITLNVFPIGACLFAAVCVVVTQWWSAKEADWSTGLSAGGPDVEAGRRLRLEAGGWRLRLVH